MRKWALLLVLLLAATAVKVNASSISPVKHETINGLGVDSTTIIAELPFNSAQQVYVFRDGYAVCNGSLAVISYDGVTLTINASKLLYLPKHKVLLFYNTSGLYKVEIPSLEMERIFTGSLDGFWVSVGQNLIYAWCCYTLRAIDLSGLIKASVTYEWPVKYVIPYAYDYWLAVITSNGTHYQDYFYSDGRRFTLQYVRTRPVSSDAFFVDWGGDKTLIFANTTHLIYWRTYYDTVTVYQLPTALSVVKLFQAISYWSYSVVLASNDTVILFTRGMFYTYSFSGGVSCAKMYVGMRTWGADYPWLITASDDGLRIVYINPDTNDWTSQTIYIGPIHSDVYIDDIDLDGAEEFYFVNTQRQLMCVEIEQVHYGYSYRAVIPSMYFWAGNFLIYDRSASDWDGDRLTNGREVNELQTSMIRDDTDADSISDYDEVYKYSTNPVLADTDGDGLTDGYEIAISKTNPTKADTDGDGLNDGFEISIKIDPLDNDTDKDGLLDGKEVQLGTNPLKPDTDGDGLPDGEEAKYGTDPTKADTDDDKLTDFEEIHTFHTNPKDPDSDNDGLTDYDEVKVYHTNPLKSDTDGDGVLDGTEVELGFNPLDPKNNPRSAWYVVTTFWWAFVFVFFLAFGMGMIATLTMAYVIKRQKKQVM